MNQYNCYKCDNCNAEFTKEEFKEYEGFCNKCNRGFLFRLPLTEKHIVDSPTFPKIEKECRSEENLMEEKTFNYTFQYKCENCNAEFTKEEFKNCAGFCNKCNDGILVRSPGTVTKKHIYESATFPKIKGNCSLGIYVLDFSESMDEEIYSKIDIRKIDALSNIIERTIPPLKNVTNAKDTYIALIGFARNAELLGIIRCSEIKETEFWKKWIIEKREEILKSGKGTNISAALELARKVYDAALNGQMDEFGLKDFDAPLYVPILLENYVFDIANIRVFLFTDGGHNVPDGPFLNHFEGASVIPGKNNISGLVIFYFGQPNSEKYRRLEEISGVCPMHHVKGVICIESFEYTRNYISRLWLLHVEDFSGLCNECYKEETF